MFAWMSGRLGRRRYWQGIAVLVLASIATAWAFRPQAGVLFTLCWVGVSAGRLHDMGRSGWWAAGLVVFNAGAVAAGEVASPLMRPPMIFLGSLLMLAVTLWLGVAEGDPAENRFGPPSGSRRSPAPA